MSSGRAIADEEFAGLDADGMVQLCGSLADYAEAGSLSPALAERVARFVERKFSDESDVLFAVGRLFFLSGDTEASREFLLRAGLLSPSDERLRALLGEVLALLGDTRTVNQALAETKMMQHTGPRTAARSSDDDEPKRPSAARPEDIRTEVSIRARREREARRAVREAFSAPSNRRDAPKHDDASGGGAKPRTPPRTERPEEDGPRRRASMPPPRTTKPLRIKLIDANDERKRVGPYEMIGELASGGMATVFLARRTGDGGFQRLVAIKRLHPHLASDDEYVNMFLDEARLAASIHHPNVVPIQEIEQGHGGYYVVMDFIEGDTLAGLVQRASVRLPRPVASKILHDALMGLHAAHEATDADGVPLHLVHRDMTPHNILVGLDGTARITDFGIARVRSQMKLSNTRPQMVKGKVAYLSPEQAYAHELDRRSDLFTMGIVLWEALAGRSLFLAETEAVTLSKLLSGPIPTVRSIIHDTPNVYDEVCRRALARDRQKRWRSAAEMAEALENAAIRAGDGLASPREVGLWVDQVIGAEIAAQREAVRNHLGPMEGSPMSRRPSSMPGRSASVSMSRVDVEREEKAEKEASKNDTSVSIEVAEAPDDIAAEVEKHAHNEPARTSSAPGADKPPSEAKPKPAPARGGGRRWMMIAGAVVVLALAASAGTAKIWLPRAKRMLGMAPPQKRAGKAGPGPSASASGRKAPSPPKPAPTAPPDDDLGPDLLGQGTAPIEVAPPPSASAAPIDK